MGRALNLEAYSYVQLTALRAQIDRLVVKKSDDALKSLKAEFAAMARDGGFELDEIVGRAQRRKVAIKYRHPADATLTWSGRGLKPRWLAAALKQRGTKIQDFLVG